MPAVTGRLAKRSHVDFDDSEIWIALVAIICPIKRIADAVYVLKIIHDSVSKIVLYVIGNGDQSQLPELFE